MSITAKIAEQDATQGLPALTRCQPVSFGVGATREMMKKTWDIIGAPYDLSANERGASAAPEVIRSKYLSRWLPRFKTHWEISANDAGDIPVANSGSTGVSKVDSLAVFSEALFSRVMVAYEQGHLPLVIGGDHSISVGSVSAASAHLRRKHGDGTRLGLLWVDAHADLNTAESGNLHGRAAAILCGSGPSRLTQIGGYSPKLSPENLIELGIQELMPTERDFIKENGVMVQSIRAVDKIGVRMACAEALRTLQEKTDGIFLSVDIDVCQAECFGACAAPMVGGLTARELCLMVEMVTTIEKCIGMDIVEYCPSKDGTGNTLKLIENVLNTALGYTTQF